jgi:hypothetical protein
LFLDAGTINLLNQKLLTRHIFLKFYNHLVPFSLNYFLIDFYVKLSNFNLVKYEVFEPFFLKKNIV